MTDKLNNLKAMKYTKSSGFTLIELMITVAIIGILAAIAYPNYIQYIQRGWRSDARVSMLENAQFMARVYSKNLTYQDNTVTPAINPTLPLLRSPQGSTGNNSKYTMALGATGTSTTNTGYLITATPNGWTDATCGNLTIDQNGTKGQSIGTQATCWQR